jgi:ABC-type nitrate/sulfonate/bicarbonate transport system permease component
MAELISSPELVAVELYELLLSGDYVPHMADTLRRIVYAFTVSMVVGTVTGIAMGMSDFWESFLRDYVIVALAIPSLFAAVFAGMWFGLSDLTPTVAGMLIAFPFMTQNVMGGVNDLDHRLIEMSDAFSISRYRVMRRVIVGSVLPYWFSGIRYTFAICWKLTVLAEVVASESGMGFVIQRMMARFSLIGTLSYVLLFTAVIVLVEYGVFQQIEKRVFEWREETSLGFVN